MKFEIQFFDEMVLDFWKSHYNGKVNIIASGLNMDFRGEPFKFKESEKDIRSLRPYASVTELRAVCTHNKNGKICGKQADYSQRLINGKPAPYDSPTILVGSSESYEARCFDHYSVP